MTLENDLKIVNGLSKEEREKFVNECLKNRNVLNFLDRWNRLESNDESIVIEIDHAMYAMITYWQVTGLPENVFQDYTREMLCPTPYSDNTVMFHDDLGEVSLIELLYLIKNNKIKLYQMVLVAGDSLGD